MNKKISLIISIRNRDYKRIETVVDSIRKNNANPSIILVDYGSKAQMALDYQKTCRELNVEYLRMETEGWLWNRCYAINAGAKKSNTEYIVSTDVDMIYVSNPFSYCLENFRSKTMYHMYAYWLPKNGNKKKAIFGGTGSQGGFQFIERNAFFETGGYDEKIQMWGSEDHDWTYRLKLLGYEQVWLEGEHKIYHVWHKGENKGYNKPLSISFNTVSRLYKNQLEPKLNQDWGKQILLSDRPILNAIENTKAVSVRFSDTELDNFVSVEKVLQTKNHSFVELNLSPRIHTSPFPDLAVRGINKVIKNFGLEFSPKVNLNIDYFLAILPILQKNGLVDYYIADDFSSVYLLWN